MVFENEETEGPLEVQNGKKPGGLHRLFGRRAASGGEPAPDGGMIARKASFTSPEMDLEEAGVLAFGKKRTAVGLTWASPDAGVSIKAKIEEMNALNRDDPTQQTVDFKYYTDPKRTGFIGLGSADWGHKTGMKALVTMLAPELTGPRWIGVFPLDQLGEVWWIGSVRDGKVFEDQVVRSAERAQESFMGDLAAPDWTAVYAPKEWGIPGANDDRLYELVDLRRGEMLKSVTPLRDNLPRLLLGAVTVSLATGGYLYFEHRKAEEMRVLEEMRRKAEQSMTYSPQDLPWFKSTPIGQFVETCFREIEKSVVLVPGWEAQPISCTVTKGAGTISTGWKRSGGRFAWLRSAVSPEDPAPLLGRNGNTASWSRSFTAATDDEAIAREPWRPEIIETRLRERFQVFDVPIAIRQSSKNQKSARTHPVFNSHDLRITAEYGMANFGDILSDVPALVPEALIYNLKTSKWDLAFKAYHPPLLPPQPK